MGMREPSHWLLLTLPDPALSWFTNPQHAHCRTEPDQTRDYHTELFPLLQARQPLALLPSLSRSPWCLPFCTVTGLLGSSNGPVLTYIFLVAPRSSEVSALGDRFRGWANHTWHAYQMGFSLLDTGKPNNMQEGFSLSKSSYSRWPEIPCEEGKGCGGLFLEVVSQWPHCSGQLGSLLPLCLQPSLLDQPQICTCINTVCLGKGLLKLGNWLLTLHKSKDFNRTVSNWALWKNWLLV